MGLSAILRIIYNNLLIIVMAYCMLLFIYYCFYYYYTIHVHVHPLTWHHVFLLGIFIWWGVGVVGLQFMSQVSFGRVVDLWLAVTGFLLACFVQPGCGLMKSYDDK